MYKKLTFIFVATFVIALVFFSSYFVIREVRGVNIGGILDMNGQSIFNVGDVELIDTDLVTKGYLKKVGNLCIGGECIDSWCDAQYFTWCAGAPDPYPDHYCGDGTCNTDEYCDICVSDCGVCSYCGDGDCGPGENKFTCPEDCGILE